jgi:GxxExxY protein
MNKPVPAKIIYAELSFKIMECAFEVHNQLGPGFSEDIYEQALTFELAERGIQYTRQKPVEVTYKNIPIGVYRLDLVIEDKVILELKAVSALNEQHKQQLLSYLKASHLQLGILINFGSRKVESSRIVHTC